MVVGRCWCGWVCPLPLSLFVFNINGRVVLVLAMVVWMVGLWWVTIGEERFGGLACGGREIKEEEREIDEE